MDRHSEKDFMVRSPRPRKTANLPETVYRRLNIYALAAGAAGGGALALAQPSEARIVHTPVHVHIVGSYNLDLNHDGVGDFKLTTGFSQVTSKEASGAWMFVYGLRKSNGAAIGEHRFPRDLRRGIAIGPRQFFGTGSRPDSKLMAFCGFGISGSYEAGNWLRVKNRYLGLRFTIKRKVHYGWARLSVEGCFFRGAHLTATLTGYAYETIPNKSIIAGATKGPDDAGIQEPDATVTMPTRRPASLGALALGSPGLSIWRREESALGER
jgi:hypothetical protein